MSKYLVFQKNIWKKNVLQKTMLIIFILAFLDENFLMKIIIKIWKELALRKYFGRNCDTKLHFEWKKHNPMIVILNANDLWGFKKYLRKVLEKTTLIFFMQIIIKIGLELTLSEYFFVIIFSIWNEIYRNKNTATNTSCLSLYMWFIIGNMVSDCTL